MLVNWCCSVQAMWVQILLREEQKYKKSCQWISNCMCILIPMGKIENIFTCMVINNLVNSTVWVKHYCNFWKLITMNNFIYIWVLLYYIFFKIGTQENVSASITMFIFLFPIKLINRVYYIHWLYGAILYFTQFKIKCKHLKSEYK